MAVRLIAFSRKERRESKESWTQRNLLALEPFGTEVDEQAVFQFHRLQIVQQLCDVCRNKRRDGFQLDNDSFHHQVSHILAENEAILVDNADGNLRLHGHADFCKPVRQAVFVDLFEIARPQIDMQIVSDLPDLAANRFGFLLCHACHFGSLSPLRSLRQKLSSPALSHSSSLRQKKEVGAVASGEETVPSLS